MLGLVLVDSIMLARFSIQEVKRWICPLVTISFNKTTKIRICFLFGCAKSYPKISQSVNETLCTVQKIQDEIFWLATKSQVEKSVIQKRVMVSNVHQADLTINSTSISEIETGRQTLLMDLTFKCNNKLDLVSLSKQSKPKL